MTFKVFGFYKFIKIKSLKKNKDILQKFLLVNDIRGTIIIAKEGLNGTISGSKKNIEKTIKKLKSLFSFKYFDNSNDSKSKLQPFHKPKVKIRKKHLAHFL
jgi:Predicted sulfurtransferase